MSLGFWNYFITFCFLFFAPTDQWSKLAASCRSRPFKWQTVTTTCRLNERLELNSEWERILNFLANHQSSLNLSCALIPNVAVEWDFVPFLVLFSLAYHIVTTITIVRTTTTGRLQDPHLYDQFSRFFSAFLHMWNQNFNYTLNQQKKYIYMQNMNARAHTYKIGVLYWWQLWDKMNAWNNKRNHAYTSFF